jgi:ligand-binding sensor domain-containing protein
MLRAICGSAFSRRSTTKAMVRMCLTMASHRSTPVTTSGSTSVGGAISPVVRCAAWSFPASNAGDSVAWFGTADGLNRLDFGESPFGTDDDSILSYTTSVRSPAITVFTVADAGFGRVWVGSDAGLTLFDYSATPHSKADDSWLALNEIYSSVSWSAVRALETDREGRLWVGMSKRSGDPDWHRHPRHKLGRQRHLLRQH